MKDIDELIKELRSPCPHENRILCQDAAAVIEPPSSILKLLGDEDSYPRLPMTTIRESEEVYDVKTKS